MAGDGTAAPAPETQKTPEIIPGLDKLKAALAGLRDRVGEEKAADFESELRLAFDKDMEELKIPEGDQRDKMWKEVFKILQDAPSFKDIVDNKVETSTQKKALDDFIEKAENLDALKAAIDKAGEDVGVIRKFVNYLKDKWGKSDFSKQIGWDSLATFIGGIMIEYATAALKKMETSDSPISDAFKKPFFEGLKALGNWILPETQKKIKELEANIRKDFVDKKYGDAKKKAEELLALDPKSSVAKEYLEKIAALPPVADAAAASTEVAPAAAPAAPAEFAQQKPIIDEALKAFAQNSIPFQAPIQTEYTALLKEYDNDAQKAAGAIRKAATVISAAAPGMDVSLRDELQKHDDLKDEKFKFLLEDVALMDTAKYRRQNNLAIVGALRDTNAFYRLPDKKPATLRRFMKALKANDASLAEFRKK